MSKLKVYLPFYPAIPFLGIYATDILPHAQQRLYKYIYIYTRTMFVIVKNWKPSRCPSTNYGSSKQWISISTCTEMNYLQNNVKWKKWGIEEYIKNVIVCMLCKVCYCVYKCLEYLWTINKKLVVAFPSGEGYEMAGLW